MTTSEGRVLCRTGRLPNRVFRIIRGRDVSVTVLRRFHIFETHK